MGNWQNLEKEVAKRLGGIRHQRKDFGEEDLDVETPNLIVECKFRKTIPSYIEQWLGQARKYKTNNNDNRIPVLVWKGKNKKIDDALVIMRFEDFELLNNQNKNTLAIPGLKEAKETFAALAKWLDSLILP